MPNRKKWRAERKNMITPVVLATCSTCGDVSVIVTDVQVQVCLDTSVATYSLVCPKCSLLVHKEAADWILEALAGAGAKLVVWSLPAELSEEKVGEPIKPDDLLNLHLALEASDPMKEIIA